MYICLLIVFFVIRKKEISHKFYLKVHLKVLKGNLLHLNERLKAIMFILVLIQNPYSAMLNCNELKR